MTVLVTGGAGFIGSHIDEHFHRRAELRILENLRTGAKNNLRSFDFDFIEEISLKYPRSRPYISGTSYVSITNISPK
jgi:UDP-glucose 4-epimerase